MATGSSYPGPPPASAGTEQLCSAEGPGLTGMLRTTEKTWFQISGPDLIPSDVSVNVIGPSGPNKTDLSQSGDRVRVEYTPRVAGEYSVDVKVNDLLLLVCFYLSSFISVFCWCCLCFFISVFVVVVVFSLFLLLFFCWCYVLVLFFFCIFFVFCIFLYFFFFLLLLLLVLCFFLIFYAFCYCCDNDSIYRSGVSTSLVPLSRIQ